MATIARTPIAGSSMITEMGYHPESQTVAVQIGGKVYHHSGVTEEDWAAFQSAESKGKHYNAFVKTKSRGELQPVEEPRG